jgi:hypothetical protein
MTPGLFYAKFDPELNTKVEENFSSFPTAINMPSNGRWFRRNDFLTMTGFAENCISGQIAATTGKMKSGAVRVGFFC